MCFDLGKLSDSCRAYVAAIDCIANPFLYTQRNFQPFPGHSGVREYLLRQKLPFVQYLISRFWVMMKEQEMTYIRFDRQLYHIFPGAVPPSSFLFGDLRATVLGVVNQQIYI